MPKINKETRRISLNSKEKAGIALTSVFLALAPVTMENILPHKTSISIPKPDTHNNSIQGYLKD